VEVTVINNGSSDFHDTYIYNIYIHIYVYIYINMNIYRSKRELVGSDSNSGTSELHDTCSSCSDESNPERSKGI
jgi:hypothetical protein